MTGVQSFMDAFGRRLKSMDKFASPALVASGSVLIITVWALFVPPFIGMADNGDYFRILYGNGLYFNIPDYDSYYFGYFIKEYGIFQYFNENSSAIFSSQSLWIQLAIWINRLFDAQTFDVRVLGAMLTLFYVVAIYLLIEALTWKIRAKYGYLIAGLAIFLFADTAYTAFFNSFYGESIVWISMLYFIAAGLLLYRNRYNDYVLLAIFFTGALLLTTSKQQNAPVGILIALAGVFLVFLRKAKWYRWGIVSALAALLVTSIGSYVLIPKEFVNINQYHAMTRGILPGSANPETTLERFNIDKQFAILNETIYYELYTTVDVNSDILQEQFYNRYGFASILLYYITHPGRAFEMLDLAAKSAFTIRPPAMGNFEKSAGKPFGAQTSFFSVYSQLKQLAAPKTFGFVVIWMLVIIGLYLPSFVSAIRSRDMRQALRLPLVVTMIAMGLSGIAVSIIGAGDADLSKHAFMFTAAFDIVTFVFVADIVSRQLWRGESDA